jgi:hypothetical protein
MANALAAKLFKEEKNSVVDRESTFSPFEPDFI